MWLIKPYPTELLSGPSSTDLLKGLLGAPKQRKGTETALRVYNFHSLEAALALFWGTVTSCPAHNLHGPLVPGDPSLAERDSSVMTAPQLTCPPPSLLQTPF